MAYPGFTEDCKFDPYWWDNTPQTALPEQALPDKVDVLVVGAGYSGLQAALQISRGGRETLVLDAARIGHGCSSRNGGQISTSIKPGLEKLTRLHGKAQAFEILQEGHRALAYIEEFVHAEGLDCHFSKCGKFIGAHNPREYERLAHITDNPTKGLETDAWVIPRAEQHREIGSDLYHGGILYPNSASLDPAAYLRGLLALTQASGATVIEQLGVLGINKNSNGFSVTTEQGVVQARDVVVATNGYTGRALRWFQRRIIPIGSYLIATEPLSADLMDELVPHNRMLGDTRKLVVYYRASPDKRRIVYGARVSLAETEPRITAPRLHAGMTQIFPQLANTRVSHAWHGFVGYTFDTLPHCGQHDGIYYTMGYCGSGVSLASYLGMRVGQQVLGLPEGKTPFDTLTFQTRPLYTGNPWFLGMSVQYYRWRDRLGF